MRSVSEHRTLSLNSRKDTKATSSTVQLVAILCISVQFVLLLTVTSSSRGDLVNWLSDAVICHGSTDIMI